MTSEGLDIAALRALTPGCSHRNHLNNAGAAPLTTPTIAAMTHQQQLEAAIGGYEAAVAAAKNFAFMAFAPTPQRKALPSLR